MPVEIFMRKRPAGLKGEVGLFVDVGMFADDFAKVPAGDVIAHLSTGANAKLLKYMWALATIVADNTEFYLDREEAMDDLMLKARHCQFIVDQKTGVTRLRRKSLRRLDYQEMSRLAERMKYIVVTEILPSIDQDEMAKAIELMVGGKSAT